MFAAMEGHLEVVKALLQAGADVNLQDEVNNCTYYGLTCCANIICVHGECRLSMLSLLPFLLWINYTAFGWVITIIGWIHGPHMGSRKGFPGDSEGPAAGGS